MAKKKTSEKTENKKNKSEKKTSQRKKEDQQLKWVLGFMAFMILLAIAVPFVKKNFIDRFEYINLDFQKSITGDTIFYSTEFPVVDDKGEITHYYAISLRNDPRALERIPIDEEIEKEGVLFIEKNTVYISIDPNMNSCEDNSISLFTLANFLRDSGLSVKSAMSDEEYAKTTDFPYINCENSQSNTVIKVRSGNETSINKIKTNCYEIVYEDCEIQQGVEKFIVTILEEYMNRFQKV